MNFPNLRKHSLQTILAGSIALTSCEHTGPTLSVDGDLVTPVTTSQEETLHIKRFDMSTISCARPRRAAGPYTSVLRHDQDGITPLLDSASVAYCATRHQGYLVESATNLAE